MFLHENNPREILRTRIQLYFGCTIKGVSTGISHDLVPFPLLLALHTVVTTCLVDVVVSHVSTQTASVEFADQVLNLLLVSLAFQNQHMKFYILYSAYYQIPSHILVEVLRMDKKQLITVCLLTKYYNQTKEVSFLLPKQVKIVF